MTLFLKEDRLNAFCMGGANVKTAGFHDGMRATLSFDSLNNRVVFFHEHSHERVFTGTIDGSILALLWVAIDNPENVSPERLAAIQITARTMLDFSRNAHEVFATYNGIKMADQEEEEGALSRLDEEYSEYFHQAAEVIDSWFKSSFLQARVAWSMTHHVFTSRFALRFLADPWLKWQDLHVDETPNLRLKMLLEDLSSGGGSSLGEAFRTCAGEFFEREPVTPWDIDDEESWKRDPAAGYSLDLALGDAMNTWLTERAVVPKLNPDERHACYRKLGEVARELGIKAEFLSPKLQPARMDPEADFETNVADFAAAGMDEYEAYAVRQADSLIDNPIDVSSIPFIVGSVQLGIEDLVQADELLVVSGDYNKASEPWAIMRFGPEGSAVNFNVSGRWCYAERYSASETIDWLNSVADYLLALRHSGSSPLIVLPLGRQGRVLQHLSIEHPREVGCLDRCLSPLVVFYSVERWVRVMELGIALGGIELTQLQVGVIDQRGQEQPMSLHIARSPALPSCAAMRAFSSDASNLVNGWMLAKHGSSDTCRRLSSDEARSAGIDLHAIGRAFGGVLACWSKL